MKNRRGLLQLEGLTERIVPAVSIRAVDGDLVISGIANSATTGQQNLFITVTGDNEVTIRDGGTSASAGGITRGVYEVSGDLILNLSNRNDVVTIDFGGAFSLDGNVTANLNNGNDSLLISNSGAANAGILGDITVDGGNGNDTFTVTNSGIVNSTLSVGGTLSFNGGAGTDTMNANNSTAAATSAAQIAGLDIGNGMVMTRVNNLSVATGGKTSGTNSYTTPVTIDGNITFNASTDKLIPNTVTFGSATNTATLAGALTLTGGQGADTVVWNQLSVVDVIPAEDTVLEVSVNLGLGLNNLTLTDTVIGIGGTDADFAYTGGTGTDNIILTGGGNSISGSVTVSLGKGTNTFQDSDTAYDKNVTITGGDNADTITMDTASIGGLLSVSLGKGTNGLDLNATGSVAGGLTYVGTSGVDTVDIATGDDLAGDVSISLGANADSLDLSGFTSVSTVNYASLIIDLGVDSSIDTVDYDSDLNTIWTDPLNLGFTDDVNSV